MSDETLHILWTNDNPDTAEHMVFMYATNSLRLKWWEEVHLIIWGINTRLVCDNERLQKLLLRFIEAGGSVSACRQCAENLGVTARLESLGDIEVIYMGEPLTRILKNGEKLLTI